MSLQWIRLGTHTSHSLVILRSGDVIAMRGFSLGPCRSGLERQCSDIALSKGHYPYFTVNRFAGNTLQDIEVYLLPERVNAWRRVETSRFRRVTNAIRQRLFRATHADLYPKDVITPASSLWTDTPSRSTGARDPSPGNVEYAKQLPLP